MIRPLGAPPNATVVARSQSALLVLTPGRLQPLELQ